MQKTTRKVVRRPQPKKAAQNRRGKPKPAPRPVSSPSRAIVVRPANLPGRDFYNLDAEQVTIIKNTVAKGASDLELSLFLSTCKRHRLDPFIGEVWLVPRWDSNADSGQRTPQNEPILGAYVRTTQIGIKGLQHIAARDHRDYGSMSLPEYGPVVEVKKDGVTIKAPEWARVKLWKKSIDVPTEAEAWFEEYCPDKLGKAPFWRKMPRRMISKCAIALAIQQAYPELSTLYVPEQMDRMAEEAAPSGRAIEAKPLDAHQKYLQREAENISQLTPEQQEVLQRQMKATADKMAEPLSASVAKPVQAAAGRETQPPVVDIQKPREDTSSKGNLFSTALNPATAKPIRYVWHDAPKEENQYAEIYGEPEMMVALAGVLSPFWVHTAKKHIMKAKALGQFRDWLTGRGLQLVQVAEPPTIDLPKQEEREPGDDTGAT